MSIALACYRWCHERLACVSGRWSVGHYRRTHSSQLSSGDSRKYHTFPTAQLPGALTHRVVVGRAVASTAETATRPPTRLLRQRVHGLTRSHTARVQARRPCTQSYVGQETGALSSWLTRAQSSVLVYKARCTFDTTGCLVSHYKCTRTHA